MTLPDPQALAVALARHLGIVATVEHVQALSGGASSETISFDAVTVDGDRMPLILRRDRAARGGPAVNLERAVEAELQRAAYEAGVPVARVRLVLDEGDRLGSGYVMDRIAGETIARKILRDDEFSDARAAMAAQCGEILARLHGIDPLKAPRLPDAGVDAQLEAYRNLLDGFGEPHPAFEIALRWLARHKPAGRPTTVVHGDFRTGNFIVGPEGVRAVLDWELAHLGDPMQDLGWLCVNSWRFGHTDRPVGGFGAREDLFAAYEAAGGGAVDPALVRYWEVFGNLKWGLICLVQAFTHLTGAHRSVELAAIGRRACEPAIDLLDLIADVPD